METDTVTGNKTSKRRQSGWCGRSARNRTLSKRKRAGMKPGNGGLTLLNDQIQSGVNFIGGDLSYRRKANHSLRVVDVKEYFAKVGMVKF